jgi:hypothetical protein
LRQVEQQLKRLGVDVAVVTFEAGFLAKSYVQETGLEWPLLVDQTRDLYRAYDMLEAGFWDVWGPSTMWAYLKAILGGAKLQSSEGDMNQRGGDVLVDPGGIVRLHHVGSGPADRPTVQKILEAVKEAAA